MSDLAGARALFRQLGGVTPSTFPSAPVGLAATGVTDGAILSWAVPANPDIKIVVETAPEIITVEGTGETAVTTNEPGAWGYEGTATATQYFLPLPAGPRWVRLRASLYGRLSVEPLEPNNHALGAVLATAALTHGEVTDYILDTGTIIDGIIEDIEGTGGLNERVDDIVTDITGPGGINETIDGIIGDINDPGGINDLIGGLRTDLTTEVNTRVQQVNDLWNGVGALEDSTDADRLALQSQIDTLNGTVAGLTAQVGDIMQADEWAVDVQYYFGELVKFTSGAVAHLYRALQDSLGNQPGAPGSEAYWEYIGNYVSLGEAVSATVGRVNVHDTMFTEVEGDINLLVSDLSALSVVVDEKATITALDAVQAQVTTNGDEIAAHGTRLSSLETTVNDPTTGVAATASGLTALTTDVQTNANGITAVATDVTALQSKIGEDVETERYREDFGAGALDSWTPIAVTEAEIVYQTGVVGATGGTTVLIGDNTNDDDFYYADRTEAVPFDPAKLYRARVRYRRHSGGGLDYFGFQGLNSSGGSIGNLYLISVGGKRPPFGEWTEYSVYVQGTHAAGSGYTGSGTKADPYKVPNTTAALSPLMLLQWAGNPGQSELDYFTVDEVALGNLAEAVSSISTTVAQQGDSIALHAQDITAINVTLGGAIAQEVINEKFDADTGWSKGTGWTISNGVASHTGATASYLTKTGVAPVSGTNYRLEVEVTQADASNFIQLYIGDAPALTPNLTTVGTHVITGTAPATNPLGFSLRGVGNVGVTAVRVYTVPAVGGATADALNALTTRVEDNEDGISAVSQEVTALTAKIGADVLGPELVPDFLSDSANGAVTQTQRVGVTKTVVNGELVLTAADGDNDWQSWYLSGIEIGAQYRVEVVAKRGAQGTKQAVNDGGAPGWLLPIQYVPAGTGFSTLSWTTTATNTQPRVFTWAAVSGGAAGDSIVVQSVSVRKIIAGKSLAEAINALTVDVQQNADGITAVATDVTALQVTVNHPTMGVAATATGLDALDTRVVATENGITAHAGRLTSLETTVNDPSTGVVATANALAVLTTDVGTIDGRSFANAADITALKAQVGEEVLGENLVTNTYEQSTPVGGVKSLDVDGNTVFTQADAGSNRLEWRFETALGVVPVVGDQYRITVVAKRGIGSAQSFQSHLGLTGLQNWPVPEGTEFSTFTGVGTVDGPSVTLRFYTSVGPTSAAGDSVIIQSVSVRKLTPVSLAEAINALTVEVQEVEGGVVANASDITDLQVTVNHPTTGVAATSSALASLTSDVSNLDGEVTSNSASIVQLQNTINDPNTGLGATSTALDVLESEVRHTTTGLSATATRVTTLENTINDPATGLNATSTALDGLTSEVQHSTTGLSATAARVTALESSVNDPATGLSALSTAQDSLYSQVNHASTGLSATAGRVTTLETTVNDPSTGVDATATAVQGLTTKVGTFPAGGFTSASAAVVSLQNSITDPSTGLQANADATDALYSQVNHETTGLAATAGRVTALEGTVNDPTTGVDATASGLSGLTVKVGSFPASGYSSAAQAVTLLKGAIDDPATGLNASATAIDTLQFDMYSTNGVIDVMNFKITQLNSEVFDTNGNLKLATSTAHEALYSTVHHGTTGLSATAARVTNLESTVTNPTTGLVDRVSANETLATNINSRTNTLEAKHTIKLDVNGVISGTESINTGVTSAFKVQANLFEIKPSTGTGARVEFSDSNFRMYDSNNVLRMRWGIW